MTTRTKTRLGDGDHPIYRRIEMDLRSRVESGEWDDGKMLPSRRDMAVQYGVDVNTFQRAIAPLLEERLLSADTGRGTFVCGRGGVRALAGTDRSWQFDSNRASGSGGSALAGRCAGILAGYPPEDQWIPQIVNSFERKFSAAGGRTRFFNRLRPHIPPEIDPWISVADAVDALFSEPIDALVLIAMYDQPDLLESVQDALRRHAARLIYIGWDDVRQPIYQVYYDNRIAGYQAASHLIELGYRRMTFFAPFMARWVEERIGSARRALADHGLPPSALDIYPCHPPVGDPYSQQTTIGHEVARRGLAEEAFADAIIAANDRVAVGLTQAAVERGLQAGRDFALIGFDDDHGARIHGITTMRPPLEALGIEAAGLIERALRGDAPTQVRLSSHLLLRSSARLAPQSAHDTTRQNPDKEDLTLCNI